jgi:RNA polymerase sigma factor (sigma-70 family)
MATAPREDDRALADSFLHGEPDAMARIDAWILRAAFPFRSRLATEWEDLQQDLRLELLRLLRKDAFRGESRLKTYVWRVVSHSCLDRCRRRARRDDRQDSLDDKEMVLHHEGPAPSHRAVQKDLLFRVLHQTSEDCRRMWKMIRDGLSYREMSEVLDVTEGALRVRVLRCRKKAQTVLDELTGNGTAGSHASDAVR